jgi:hypothetical protein
MATHHKAILAPQPAMVRTALKIQGKKINRRTIQRQLRRSQLVSGSKNRAKIGGTIFHY